MAEHGGKESESESGDEGLARIDTRAAAVALALSRTTRSSDLNAKAAAFLEKQGRLADLQMEHLHDERELQHRHGRLKYFRERLAVGLQLLTLTFGAAVVVGLGGMVWQAHTASGIVVQAFSVPPDLAARGLTGQVVASQLLDRLSAMDAKTRSVMAGMKAQNDWNSGLKVEIPQTGISFGELNRFLRERLGKETPLTGEVVKTPTGLEVTVRAGEVTGASVSGAEADLGSLLQTSAEAIYKQTQPWRYVRYLHDEKRYDEYLPALEALADGTPSRDVAMAKMGMALLSEGRGDIAGATHLLDEAMAMAPDDPTIIDLYRAVSMHFGHEEARRAFTQQAQKVAGRKAASMTESGRAAMLSNIQADLAETSGDFLGGAKWEENTKRLARGTVDQSFYEPGWVGRNLALDHDAAGADAAFAREGADPKADPYHLATQQLVAAAALERWSQALAAGTALQASIKPGWDDGGGQPGLRQQIFDRVPSSWMGLAMAMSGDMAGGEARIAAGPLDCYDCVRVRGKLAAFKRDWSTAARWFAHAVKLGPSIPFAYADWGQMLLAKGDVEGALDKFKAANRAGPLFPDALEGWGEALLKQGDAGGAAAKFATADKYAPKWGRNHLMWGLALAKQGKTSEATAQWRAALGLGLTPDERARLAKAQGQARASR